MNAYWCKKQRCQTMLHKMNYLLQCKCWPWSLIKHTARIPSISVVTWTNLFSRVLINNSETKDLFNSARITPATTPGGEDEKVFEEFNVLSWVQEASPGSWKSYFETLEETYNPGSGSRTRFGSGPHQCCGSGIRCFVDPWIRESFFPDLGSRISNPYIWELSKILWVINTLILCQLIQIFYTYSKIK